MGSGRSELGIPGITDGLPAATYVFLPRVGAMIVVALSTIGFAAEGEIGGACERTIGASAEGSAIAGIA